MPPTDNNPPDWQESFANWGGGSSSPNLEIPDPWQIAADSFLPKPDYYGDVATWATHRLGEYFWDKQQEIAQSLRDNRYTAVQACHGVGKSHGASRAIAYWVDKHPPGEAFVVSTAPTAAQVKSILWREILKAHKKGRLIGRIAMGGYPEWKLDDGELVGYGRKPADYSVAAFQGVHSRFPLIVIDEAGGVDKSLYDAVDALATNENARVLAIGNPDDPSTHFATICRPHSGWNVIRVDGLRSPNMTIEHIQALTSKCQACQQLGRETSLLQDLMEQEGIPYNEEEVPEDLRPVLISALWVEERLHRWVGIPTESQPISELASQSSLFSAKVRGLFPTTSTEGIIPLGWVERAMVRWEEWDEAGRPGHHDHRLVAGADIARSGDDRTAIARRRGPVILDIRKHQFADTMVTTGMVAAILNSEPFSEAVVDVIGIGAGVVDRLRELDLPVRAFNAAASAGDRTDLTGEFHFINLRAAAWWNLREKLDPSRGSNVMLPRSETLQGDLCTPRWRVQSRGYIQVESKEDIKKRLGRSTDEGDAVVQAFWTDSEEIESYRGNADRVSWWQGAGNDAPMRWVPADALEQWLNEHDGEERRWLETS